MIRSHNCSLKLQVSIARQSQTLLDLDILARQPPALTTPIASTAPTPILTAPTAPIAPTSVLTAPIASIIPRQLSPDRPEVLMQAYLAEKEAWLAQHPTVRPTEYRKARK